MVGRKIRKKPRAAFRYGIAAMVFLACGLAPAKAEQDDSAKKLPSDASELYSPVQRSYSRQPALPGGPHAHVPGTLLEFAARIDEPVVFQGLKERLRRKEPFFRDTLLNLHFRTGYITQENPDGTQSQSWAAGPALWYESGYLRNWLQVGAAVFSAQPIVAPDSQGGTLLLTPDQQQMTTLGLAYARMRFLNHEITAGRQHIKTPYANPHDNRMIPISFEGVVLEPRHDVAKNFHYISGYLWRYKPRDSSVFESFSNGLEVEPNRGMLITGAKYVPVKGLTFGAINYWIADTLNTAYGEVDWLLSDSGHHLKYRFGVTYTDQRSVGEQLIEGAPFDTFQVSARSAVSVGSLTMRTAASANGNDSEIRSPFGSFPAYTALDQANFERAGEKSVALGLAYDFSDLICEGLRMQVAYGLGRDAVDPETGLSLQDRDELDLNIEYRPTYGPLENVRFQLDYSRVVFHGGGSPRRTDPQLVAIFTYLVPLL